MSQNIFSLQDVKKTVDTALAASAVAAGMQPLSLNVQKYIFVY